MAIGARLQPQAQITSADQPSYIVRSSHDRRRLKLVRALWHSGFAFRVNLPAAWCPWQACAANLPFQTTKVTEGQFQSRASSTDCQTAPDRHVGIEGHAEQETFTRLGEMQIDSYMPAPARCDLRQ